MACPRPGALPDLATALFMNYWVSILAGGRGAIACARERASCPGWAQLLAPVSVHHVPDGRKQLRP